MQTKDHALGELRILFGRMLVASAAGGSGTHIQHGRGCVDGYMRAMLDLGVATRAELLDLIAAERERANGPAVRSVDCEDSEESATSDQGFRSIAAA